MRWDTEILDPGDEPDEHVPDGLEVVQDWEPISIGSVWVPYRDASPDADGYVDYTVLWRRKLAPIKG